MRTAQREHQIEETETRIEQAEDGNAVYGIAFGILISITIVWPAIFFAVKLIERMLHHA